MNKKVVFLLIIALTTLTPQITPSTGLAFSFVEYRFYIDKPTIISYPEMKFSFVNSGSDSIQVNCSYNYVSGLNITVNLTWTSITISPDSRIENNYAINVKDTFNTTALIQITCMQKSLGQKDNPVASGGVIINWVTYYSENDGSLLNLQIVDQSNKLRNSSVSIFYKKDNTVGWSPIKQFNDSRFDGYLPNGKYQIIAIDLQSGIVGEIQFDLTENLQTKVVLELIGFNQFLPLISNKRLGLNFTINNYLETIYEVKIYAILTDSQNQFVSETQMEERTELEKATGLEFVTWFNLFDWKNDNYTITGYIFSQNVNIAKKSTEIRPDEELYKTKTEKNNVQNIDLFRVVLIALIFIFSSIYVGTIIKRKKNQILCTNCSRPNLGNASFCSSCGSNIK